MFESLSFLKADLSNHPIIHVSLTPDVPSKDEQIDHEVLSFDFKETKSGLLLLMELKNKETGDKYTYAFPDIQQIEMHNFEKKYYLHSIDRGKLSDHELEKTTKLLRENKFNDNVNFFEDAPKLTNRIIIKK